MISLLIFPMVLSNAPGAVQTEDSEGIWEGTL